MGACKWRHDVDTDSWDTTCGNKHQFMAGGPGDNGHLFCPYCGKRIIGVVAATEVDE